MRKVAHTIHTHSIGCTRDARGAGWSRRWDWRCAAEKLRKRLLSLPSARRGLPCGHPALLARLSTRNYNAPISSLEPTEMGQKAWREVVRPRQHHAGGRNCCEARHSQLQRTDLFTETCRGRPEGVVRSRCKIQNYENTARQARLAKTERSLGRTPQVR